MQNTYTQAELLQLMETYNSTDRQLIKQNLKAIKRKYNFDNIQIEKQLGYKPEKLKGWFNRANPTIPTFEDVLKVAVQFGFDIQEVLSVEK